jgi:tetratricopeptide (TPR) repeat protein
VDEAGGVDERAARRRRGSIAGALSALLLLATPTAHAQDPEALYARGIQLREGGDDEAALEQFARAYALAPSGRLLAQMGFAEQALGRWPRAEEHLLAAQAARTPWIVSHASVIQGALATIAARLGTVELIGGVAGARVRVDGEDRGTLPAAARVRVPAGSMVVEVQANGYFTYQRALQVAAGATVRETVELTVRSGAEGADGLVIAGAVNLGIGALAGVLSGVFYALREGEAAFLASNACDPAPGQRVGDIPACRDAHAYATSYEAASIGTLIGAGVLVVAGAVLLAVGASASTPSAASMGCFDERSPLGCRF